MTVQEKRERFLTYNGKVMHVSGINGEGYIKFCFKESDSQWSHIRFLKNIDGFLVTYDNGEPYQLWALA